MSPAPSEAVPKANGLPGWTATRHRSIRPSCSKAVRTTSYGPDRDAARDDDRVRLLGEARLQVGQHVVEAVLGDAQSQRLAAGRVDERREARAVGIGDPGRAERLSGRRGSRRRWPGRRSAAADGPTTCDTPAPARQGDPGGGHGRARLEDRDALGQVRAAPTDRRAWPDRLVDEDRRRRRTGRVAAARPGRVARGVGRRRELDLDDGVGAGRDRRPGRDPDGRAALHGLPCGRCPARTSPMTLRVTGPSSVAPATSAARIA